MHVLTKIFVVLVSLLAVMLVPLVVVYAHNESSYQEQFQAAESQSAAARSSLETAKANYGSAVVRKDAQIQELSSESDEMRRLADRQEAEIRELKMRVANAESADNEIRTQLGTMSNAFQAGQQLNETLIEELRSLRTEALASERQKVELDEALRDALAKLDAAVEARRALQEELQRLKDEYAGALEQVAEYVARHGTLEPGTYAGEVGRAIDHDVDATIISVSRRSDQVMAEIDAGSRDGVKEGWVLTVGQGATFIARLRIVTVDINRASGVIELEDEFNRGKVEVGQRAYARAGR